MRLARSLCGGLLLHAKAALCIALSACVFGLWACDKKPPTPQPQPQPPGTEERITGSERIGWDQQAADRVELTSFRYALYVDGARVELSNASCANDAGPSGFACTSGLPALSVGTHTLELAAFVVDGTILESARSSPLRVNVVPATAAAASPSSAASVSASKDESTPPRGDRPGAMAMTLVDPVDAVVAPDGRVFVAERAGRVRSVDVARGTTAVALTLDDVWTEGERPMALALDPGFDRTRLIYLVYAAAPRSGAPVFRLVRYREVNDVLGEPAVLLDGVPASQQAAAAIAVGPDGKLYVAFDEGVAPRATEDRASYNGKVLRLERDGRTPADQTTPIYAQGADVPRALAADSVSHALWIAGRGKTTSGVIFDVADQELPPTSFSRPIAAMRFHLGALLLAADQRIWRIPIEPGAATGTGAAQPLLDVGAPIRALAEGPNGSVYVCTADELLRVAVPR